MFERIYERMRMAINLLKQFDMYALSTEPDLFATIQKMMDRLQEEVAKKVYRRYQIASIGIPNTNFSRRGCCVRIRYCNDSNWS